MGPSAYRGATAELRLDRHLSLCHRLVLAVTDFTFCTVFFAASKSVFISDAVLAFLALLNHGACA